MRNYHFVNLFLFATLAYAIALLGMIVVMAAGLVPHVFGFHEQAFWLPFPVVQCIIGIFALSVLFRGAVNAIFSLVLALKGLRLDVPSSPDGLTVDPSGVWLDDEADLPVGSKVLACTRGGWHRAEVVRLLPRNRVWLHFPGWDSFLDEPFRKRNLQVPGDPASARPTPDTAIRNDIP